MKTILELQQEIRSLRNDISKMDTNLAMIESELNSMQQEKIREATGGNPGIEFDYDLLENLADNLPFIEHRIYYLEEEHICKLYLKLLLSLVWMDENAATEKLTYIQWIYGEMDENIEIASLEDLYKDSIQLEKGCFQELVELLPEQYQDNLIVDSLVVANMSGKATKEVLQFIGALCGIFGLTKEYVKNCSDIARILLSWNDKILTEEEEEIILSNQILMGEYLGYAESKKILNKWRFLAVVCSRDGNSHIQTWKVRNGNSVIKGELIAIERNWYGATTEIRSPGTGTIFYFKRNGIDYGVISHNSDNIEDVKKWMEENDKYVR